MNFWLYAFVAHWKRMVLLVVLGAGFGALLGTLDSYEQNGHVWSASSEVLTILFAVLGLFSAILTIWMEVYFDENP